MQTTSQIPLPSHTDERRRPAEIDRQAAEQRVDRESSKDDVRVLSLASRRDPGDHNRANVPEHEHRAQISGLQLAPASAVGQPSDQRDARRHFDIGKRWTGDRRTGGRHVGEWRRQRIGSAEIQTTQAEHGGLRLRSHPVRSEPIGHFPADARSGDQGDQTEEGLDQRRF